jgi:hypothetical protein
VRAPRGRRIHHGSVGAPDRVETQAGLFGAERVPEEVVDVEGELRFGGGVLAHDDSVGTVEAVGAVAVAGRVLLGEREAQAAFLRVCRDPFHEVAQPIGTHAVGVLAAHLSRELARCVGVQDREAQTVPSAWLEVADLFDDRVTLLQIGDETAPRGATRLAVAGRHLDVAEGNEVSVEHQGPAIDEAELDPVAFVGITLLRGGLAARAHHQRAPFSDGVVATSGARQRGPTERHDCPSPDERRALIVRRLR